MNSQTKNSKKNLTEKRTGRRMAGCILVFILAVCLFLVIYYGSYFIVRGARASNPQLIAHRGGPVYAPENTLAAFRNAIAVGADWLEFDVQRTRDGVLVVIHDETVERTTDGSGEVGALTYDQIKALDAGNGEPVPTFDEVIALARESGIGIMPEIKSPDLYPGIEAQMVAAIQAGDYVDNTLLQSFKGEALEKARTADPQVSVCALYGLWQFDLSDPQPEDAAYLCPMAEMVLLNPWMIRQAHQDGRQVYVWFGVIENSVVMRGMLAFGADGLMVNDPIALSKVLGR